jgi:hypothetical protein
VTQLNTLNNHKQNPATQHLYVVERKKEESSTSDWWSGAYLKVLTFFKGPAATWDFRRSIKEEEANDEHISLRLYIFKSILLNTDNSYVFHSRPQIRALKGSCSGCGRGCAAGYAHARLCLSFQTIFNLLCFKSDSSTCRVIVSSHQKRPSLCVATVEILVQEWVCLRWSCKNVGRKNTL